MTTLPSVSSWCSTTTSVTSTRRRKVRNQGGWIRPESSEGHSSNFEKNVYWKLTWREERHLRRTGFSVIRGYDSRPRKPVPSCIPARAAQGWHPQDSPARSPSYLQIALLQNGASIVYVKEQMGHSSIQVTVDIYGHLIPGANVCFVDRLDGVPAEEAKTSPQQSARPAQQGEREVPHDLLQVVDKIGGGGRTRTYDLRIMRPSL
jgi:hypothetical protein